MLLISSGLVVVSGRDLSVRQQKVQGERGAPHCRAVLGCGAHDWFMPQPTTSADNRRAQRLHSDDLLRFQDSTASALLTSRVREEGNSCHTACLIEECVAETSASIDLALESNVTAPSATMLSLYFHQRT
jgi:hypothetical protein